MFNLLYFIGTMSEINERSDKVNLGKALKIALIKKGMKGKELAEAMDVAPSSISIWIAKGNMNQSNLIQICINLDMKVSEFVRLGEEVEA